MQETAGTVRKPANSEIQLNRVGRGVVNLNQRVDALVVKVRSVLIPDPKPEPSQPSDPEPGSEPVSELACELCSHAQALEFLIARLDDIVARIDLGD